MCSSLPIRLGSLITAGVAVLVAATAVHAQIPCSYEVTAVIQGPWCGIFGFPPTTGRGITDNGAVVGHYTSCLIGPSEAFLWTPQTGLVTLDRPSGFSSAAALGVDDQGSWIVGAMTPQGANVSTAALWADGVPIDLGTLPGGNFSQARATDGQKIVGKWGNNTTGPIHGFIWEDGLMTDLGPDLGTPSSRANDISETTGRVVGWMGSSFIADGEAFIWEDAVVTGLGPIPGGFQSRANAISPDGSAVVGVGRIIDDKTGDDFSRAFHWANGEMINLGTLPGFNHAGAFAVNDDQTVVGGASQPGGSAFIWYERETGMIDLNDLIRPETGVDISLAYAIDNLGKITGIGHDAAGDVVGVVLTPIQPALGDLDRDCIVGITDLLMLLSNWGPCADPPDPCPADLDGDGSVGIIDLLTLLANWG